MEEDDATPGLEPDAIAAFAARADDLDEIKKCVNDAASTSGALWVSYLFVLFYTAIAAGAVTPVDLFMENPVKLPFLSIDLPLKAFFFLAPVLFLVTHVYTLVSFVILSDKAKWYHRELKRQIDICGANDPVRARQIQDDLRRHLVSNIFVQFLAGPGDLRQGPFGFVLKLIVWTTLVFAPAAVLLLIQVQFLPFHARAITWTHRIVLLLDLVAVWWLWYRILAGRFSEEQTWRRWSAGAAQGAIALASVLAIVFSWTIATFPGEWQEAALPSLRIVPGGPHGLRLSLHDYVFDRTIDATTRRRDGFFTSTLILPAFDIYEQLKIDEAAKAASRAMIFSARGRDLRDAVFDLSNLSQVDFEGANLRGVSFDRAILHATSFYCADLRGASLYAAQVQGAWFHASNLEDAALQSVEGQAARFEGAVLTRAHLESAKLQAARFDGADLRKATLSFASLQGSSFVAMAKTGVGALYGPCVPKERREAAARSADLGHADLTSADLEEATLRGATLTDATLGGTRLGNADLSAALMSGAKLAVDADSQNRGLLMDDLRWEGRAAADQAAGETSPASEVRAAFMAHAVTPVAYRHGLAQGLSDLVCAGDPKAAFIVHGLLENGRMADAGFQAPAAIDTILAGECSGEVTLAADDKARLIALKRRLTPRDPH